MKEFISILIFIFATTTCISQHITEANLLSIDSVDLDIFRGDISAERIADSNYKFNGSIHFTEGYELSKVSIIGSNRKPTIAYLNYDVLSGLMNMSFNKDGSDSFVLSKARNIKITFQNHIFQFIDYNLSNIERSSYVEILAELENGYILGAVHSMKVNRKESPVSAGSYAVSSSLPNIFSFIEFVIIDSDGVAIIFENDKRFVNKNVEFQYQELLKKHIKANNTKFDDDYKGLIATAAYYASLKN